MSIHRERPANGDDLLSVLITIGPEMNESPWRADTEGQGHQRKVAWTVIFVSGLDKPQAEWKKKVTKLGQQPGVEVGAAGISIKLMRQRQIKTVFRINSCPWASCSELAFWCPGAAAGIDLGGERKWGLTAERAWQGGALRSSLFLNSTWEQRNSDRWDNRRETWSQTEESKSGNWKT